MIFTNLNLGVDFGLSNQKLFDILYWEIIWFLLYRVQTDHPNLKAFSSQAKMMDLFKKITINMTPKTSSTESLWELFFFLWKWYVYRIVVLYEISKDHMALYVTSFHRCFSLLSRQSKWWQHNVTLSSSCSRQFLDKWKMSVAFKCTTMLTNMYGLIVLVTRGLSSKPFKICYWFVLLFSLLCNRTSSKSTSRVFNTDRGSQLTLFKLCVAVQCTLWASSSQNIAVML